MASDDSKRNCVEIEKRDALIILLVGTATTKLFFQSNSGGTKYVGCIHDERNKVVASDANFFRLESLATAAVVVVVVVEQAIAPTA